MQRKAVFFGSRVDKLDMIIVFSIAVIFSVSGVQADPVKPKGSEVEPICCPTKLCYQANVTPVEKMEFVITQTTCTCEPEATQCMKTFRDVEFAISKLHRIHNFPAPAPVAPASVDAAMCCVTKLCLDIGTVHPSPTTWNLVVTLIPTTCGCSPEQALTCFDSFEKIEQFARFFASVQYHHLT